MQRRPVVFALAIALMLGGGCQVPHRQPAAAASMREQTRVNSYSLLHDLLSQQKHVDKLLLIKLESAELDRLIKAIASASAAGAETLERFAARDASLNFKRLDLPAGETETRAAIARTKRRTLLSSSGAGFEFELLLTQVEALSYGWHLSKVAAANEVREDQAHYLASLSDAMKDLHHRAVSLIRSRLAIPAQRGDS